MKKPEPETMLLIGIGNSARQDDGLGWAFAEGAVQAGFFSGNCQLRFQLNIEDAELISHYHRVLFVDAHKGGLPNGFSFQKCQPGVGGGFSTHQLPPEEVLYLCGQLYGKSPEAWVLAIQGYEWELREGLSEVAQQNLARAFSWFSEYHTIQNLKSADF